MKLRIHGIKDGTSEIDLTELVENIKDISPEFFGEIQLKGTFAKYKNRFTFSGIATCNAKMTCDFCLEEFVEKIETKVEVNLIADTTLYFAQKDSNYLQTEEIAVHPDDVYYDISVDVKDFLLLSLPIRRLSPDCKGKKFNEVFRRN